MRNKLQNRRQFYLITAATCSEYRWFFAREKYGMYKAYDLLSVGRETHSGLVVNLPIKEQLLLQQSGCRVLTITL